MTTEPMIKCRFCDFTVMKFRTRKDGKVTSGWPRLFAHVEENHPDAAETMEDQLGTSYLGEANATD